MARLAEARQLDPVDSGRCYHGAARTPGLVPPLPGAGIHPVECYANHTTRRNKMPDATPEKQDVNGTLLYLKRFVSYCTDDAIKAASLMLKDESMRRAGKLKPWHHRCYACGNPRMVWLRKSSLWHCYACGVEEEAEEKIVAVVTMEK